MGPPSIWNLFFSFPLISSDFFSLFFSFPFFSLCSLFSLGFLLKHETGLGLGLRLETWWLMARLVDSVAWACQRGGWFGGLGLPISAWWAWVCGSCRLGFSFAGWVFWVLLLGFRCTAWWWLTAWAWAWVHRVVVGFSGVCRLGFSARRGDGWRLGFTAWWLGFLGFAAWVSMHSVVMVDGLGLGLGSRRGGWVFYWFSTWAWVLPIGFMGFAAWVSVHGVVVVDGLGLGLVSRRGGWKQAWACRSRPGLASLVVNE